MTRKHYVIFAAMLLLAVALAITAMAANTTNPNARGRTPAQSPGMSSYNYGELQRCLARIQLTTTQRQRINTIRQTAQRNITNIRNNRNLTEAQRDQQLRTAQRNEINQIMSVLTVQQRTQFRSCIAMTSTPSRPGGGGAGFGQVVPGVTLTAQQRQQVLDIRARANRDIQAVNRDTSLTQEQRAARIQEIRTRAHNDIMNVLTPEQRQQFQNWWANRQRGMPGGAGAGPGTAAGGGLVPGVQLSASQRQQISNIRTREMQQVQAVQQDQSLSQQEKDNRIESIRRQAHNEIISVLTPEQRQQFQDWWSRRQSGTT